MSDGITEARRGTYFSDRSKKQNKLDNIRIEAKRMKAMAKEMGSTADYILEKIKELEEAEDID